jgi:hypothetical protein
LKEAMLASIWNNKLLLIDDINHKYFIITLSDNHLPTTQSLCRI